MSMVLKICHVTSVHQRYDTRIFYKECTSLAKAGYDVTLLVADNKAPEIRNGVKIISADFKPTSRLDRILHSSRVMFKYAMQVDAEIYHLHDPELLLVAKKLKQNSKKVIFDSHENYPAQIACKRYLPAALRQTAASVYKLYETSALRCCDAVVVPCTFYGGLNIFEGRCKKTVYISNAPKLEELYDKYNPENRKWNKAICHVGGLTYERGITHLIKAAYKADVKLILAGKFSPNGYHEELQKMPEYQCVDYRGFVNRDGLMEIFNESSIGIATILDIGQYNTFDNLYTKVYEYMSVGLPVIVSKYAYADKAVSRYKFGLSVKPDDINAIAEAIRQIIESPTAAKKMGNAGRLAVKTEFNWSLEEHKLIALYQSLI